jgi:hypothetical protein
VSRDLGGRSATSPQQAARYVGTGHFPIRKDAYHEQVATGVEVNRYPPKALDDAAKGVDQAIAVYNRTMGVA